MDIKKIILEVSEEILGLEQEDMLNNMDMDLREAGLLDSVSTATLFTYVEERIHKKIDMKELRAEDVVSFNAMIAAVKRIAKL